jgi:MFS family permease
MAYSDDQGISNPKQGFFYGYIIVIAAFLIMVVTQGVHYAFGVFFKPISNELSWTRAITSGAFSLSWIIQGILGILVGGINDRFGPRMVLTVCALLFGLGYFLMSQIDAVWQIYLFYGVIIGIALGGTYIPPTSTVARWFTSRRSTMTGIILAGMGAGTFIMPPIINQLISVYDWRMTYIIMGGVVLVVMATAAQFMKRDPSKVGRLPYGEQGNIDRDSGTNDRGFSLKEAAMTGQFWQVFGILFCSSCCVFSILVHISPHATDIGISTAVATNFISTIGAASVIGKVAFGNIADRIGNRRIYIICFVLMVISLLWLMQIGEIWMLYMFAVVFGLAYGGCSVSMSPLVANLFGIRLHGLISGVVNNGFTIGATVGPLVVGYIFDVSGGYNGAFLFLAVVAITGLILTLFLKPTEIADGKI